jgi:hypothetical protein
MPLLASIPDFFFTWYPVFGVAFSAGILIVLKDATLEQIEAAPKSLDHGDRTLCVSNCQVTRRF